MGMGWLTLPVVTRLEKIGSFWRYALLFGGSAGAAGGWLDFGF